MNQSWLGISGEWDERMAMISRFFSVGFDLGPVPAGVRSDGTRVLDTAPRFFRRFFGDFVETRGNIYAFAADEPLRSVRWAQPIARVVDVEKMLNALLCDGEISSYPIAIWFVPSDCQSAPHEPLQDYLRAAGTDMDLLDEAVGAGRPRLFLDDEWGDLLARPDDRFWIRDWVVRSAAQLPTVHTGFHLL